MTSTPIALEAETLPAQGLLDLPALRQLPRVNLLPPEIAERQRMRRLQKGLAATVTAAALAVAALHQVAVHDRAAAQRELDAASATAALLATQQHAYASVPVVLKQAQAAKATLTQAMGTEVRWSVLLSDLDAHVPPGVWLTTLDVVTADATATAPTAPSPTASPAPATPTPATPATSTAPTGIATIRFGGSAVSHDAVAAWLVSVGQVPGFSNAYLSSSVEAPGSSGTPATFTFTSSVTVTAAALSDRYTTRSGS